MVAAIIEELYLRQDFLENKQLQTIYFGGGTPSLLNASEINRIIEAIHKLYDLSHLQEVTLEANPDDLQAAYIHSLQTTPIHRLSIGVQSFVDEDLLLMNRSHNAQEAEYAIKRAQDAGLTNISCDLIFGTPTLSHAQLQENIQKLADWDIPHVSAYSLTIEDRTALAAKIAKGTFTPSSESTYEQQMLLTMETLAGNDYEQYEISNYARKNQYAIHNTNYWKGVPYLGIGPSAHSYNGAERSWNVRNNAQYLQSILTHKKAPQEKETLSITDQINEMIMVSLRTKWGLSLEKVETKFGASTATAILQQAQPSLDSGLLLLQAPQTLTLSTKGKLIADAISSDLFLTE